MAPVLDFLNEAGSALCPGVPVVYYVIESPRPRRMTTSVVAKLDLKATIDVVLQVHPDLHHVFVVSGASEYDRPIYVFVNVYMGHGAIGGSVLSLDVVGRAVADVALRVLKGESPWVRIPHPAPDSPGD